MARGKNNTDPPPSAKPKKSSNGLEQGNDLNPDQPEEEIKSSRHTAEDNPWKPEKAFDRDSKDVASTALASDNLRIDNSEETTFQSVGSDAKKNSPEVENCDRLSSTSSRDSPTYDTIKSGMITCTYLAEGPALETDENKKSSNVATLNIEHDSTNFNSEVTQDPFDSNIVEDSEIDQLYDDIAGNQEPIYEELSDANANTAAMNPSQKNFEKRSIFEGASKTEILSILNDAKQRVMHDSDVSITTVPFSTSPVPKYVLMEEDTYDENLSDPGIDLTDIKKRRSHHDRLSNLSNLSDSSTTSEETSQPEDNNDDPKILQFILPPTSKLRETTAELVLKRANPAKFDAIAAPKFSPARTAWIGHPALVKTAKQPLDFNYDFTTDTYFPFVCEKCHKRRNERKEIISEIVETEIKYGNDLKILKEEFYKPMEVAGLLVFDQLQNIFINLDELRKMNSKFVEKLADALEIANEQGDEDYLTVSIGSLFLDSTPMLHGFETYCVQQASASLLLNNLQKDKELLRVFLCVSQMENTLLRRMNLPAFLMVPVQRVTKYPLLLSRLYKVTPHHHKDRDALKDVQKKIELHLEHINLMALELLQWNREEVKFVKEGKLLYTQPSECAKRNKSCKFTSVNALLVTLGRPDTSNSRVHGGENSSPEICKATLLLVKEKGSRLALLREQLHLKDCVISTDLDSPETFEVHQINTKDYLICKAETKEETMEWAHELKKHAGDKGKWRQRRNALANIMINGMNKQ
ncbi:Myosin-M heavy chain [Nymphon striatum]|nr:Myosin-M heavy chain [Nymphon striatum]